MLVLAGGLAALPSRAAEAAAVVAPRVRMVVMPALDLSGSVAPRAAFDARILDRLVPAGFELVTGRDLDAWFRERRIRYTGGLGADDLDALRERTRAEVVLFTTLDQFVEDFPPRVAATARVVDLADRRIVWTAEVAVSGRDRPGLLGLGILEDVGQVADVAAERLLADLDPSTIAGRLGAGTAPPVWAHERPRREHRPHREFRSAALTLDGRAPTRIAVLPFFNTTDRVDAGEVASMLFVTDLAGRPGLDVLEPGVVRDALLRGRVIQDQGLSLAQSDLIRELLGADLVVTGRVLTFAEALGESIPRVAFSVWVFDTRSREVVWSAYSANRGSDGVVFFQAGRSWSARSLMADMIRASAHAFAKER